MSEFQVVCNQCGIDLSEIEARMYVYRCEACEREWHERVKAWQRGGKDEELDKYFSHLKSGAFH